MIKSVFKRELNHSYLVIEDVPQQVRDSYQYKMILQNRVPGLLTCSERYLEGRACLYYDVSSRQALDQIYDSGKLCFRDISDIIEETAHLVETMMGYLLDEHFLIIKTSMIFMDLDTKRLYYAFYPLERESGDGHVYGTLADFFLEHVNHREAYAVNTAYQFYKQSKSEYFTIQSFVPFLEKEAVLCEKNSAKDYTAENTYDRNGTDISEVSESSDSFHSKDVVTESWSSTSALEGETVREDDTDYEFTGEKQEYLQRPLNGKEEQDILHRVSAGFIKRRNTEQSKREHGQRSEGSRKMTGRRSIYIICLAVCFVLSAVLSFIIWYIRPEGGNKIALAGGAVFCFVGMALSLYKWILAGKKQKEEAAEDEEDKERHVWDTYTQNYGQNVRDETVFLNFDNARMAEDEAGTHEGAHTAKLSGYVNGDMRSFKLDHLPVLAGKLEGRVQILLADTSVSRVHAKIAQKDGRKVLIDMNSTNGTYINGIRVEQGEAIGLEKGDEIRLGNCKLYYDE